MKIDPFLAVKKLFESFGYTVLARPEPQDNAPDMFVVGKKKAIKVEIKTAREKQKGSWEADSIKPLQKSCDAVAVVFPNGYIYIEKMDIYLASCSDSGYRPFTWLKLD